MELYNNGDETVALDGLFLSAKADMSGKVPLGGSIQAGGYASHNVAFPLTSGEVTLFLVNSAGTVLAAHVFARLR